MTTETVLKHLAWVGPAALFGLAYALKGFRWWVQNYKQIVPAKPAESGPVPLDVPLYVTERKDPERLYSELLQQAMQAAVDAKDGGVRLTAAGQIVPDPKTDPGHLTIVDTRPLPDAYEDGRGVGRAEILERQYGVPASETERIGPHGVTAHSMSAAERETRILGYTLYRTRLAAEAKGVEQPASEQLRGWATQKARDEFLTPAKKAEIAAKVRDEFTVQDLPVPPAEVLAEMQKLREDAYVTSVGSEAVRMYEEAALSPTGLVRGNLFAYKDDGSAATPAGKSY